MSDPIVSQLLRLTGKDYVDQIKTRLRDDDGWYVMVDPVLAERTRFHLSRMIESIDFQKARASQGDQEPDPKWLKGINMLRHLAVQRLEAIPPRVEASSREARAWRAFSAKLAAKLRAADPGVLDTLKTPYGGLTAREWLVAREEKKEMAQ